MAEYKGFGGNKALLEELLQKAKQPTGFAIKDVQGYKATYIGSFCCFYADKAEPPQLFRAKLSHMNVRWFDTAERAYAYQIAHRKPGSNSIAYQPPSKRKCNFADADEAITTAKTKYTPAAPVPERFAATGPVIGGFRTQRIGEYDMPPSKWVEAVA